MSDWKFNCNYDYRFAGLALIAEHKGEKSIPYILPMSQILRLIPSYELHDIMHRSLEEVRGVEQSDPQGMRQDAISMTNVAGKVVLDIGGYDGWAAKQALEEGAQRVICLDSHQYSHYGWEDKKLDGVEYIEGDFMYLGPDGPGPYLSVGRYGSLPQPDIIIFYNVLYHLKNPWAALDHLRTLIKPDGVMLLCTLFRYHDGPWAYLYEPRECNPTDETVYWGLSLSTLERLLTLTGWTFTREGLSYDRVVYRCTPILDFTRSHSDA